MQAAAPPARTRRRWRWLLLLPALLAVAAVAWALYEVDRLVQPATRAVGAPPGDLALVDVELPLPGGGSVRGWFGAGTPGAGAVLLLHGVRADRRQMLGRARLFAGAGHAVLLIDQPGHGQSSGAQVSFGWHEADGVRVALAHLRQRLPGERIGVVGASMGAAAFVLARAAPAPDAVVLEAMFATIEDAASNRLAQRLGPPGRLLTPLLLWQLPWRLGVDAAQLSPLAALPELHAPLLLLAGSADPLTPPAETERLFAAANPPRELRWVAGAGHVNLQRFDSAGYASAVLPFLARHLRRDAAPTSGG